MSLFQLENQYTLFDYSINVNDVILLVKAVFIEKIVVPKTEENSQKDTISSTSTTSLVSDEVDI